MDRYSHLLWILLGLLCVHVYAQSDVEIYENAMQDQGAAYNDKKIFSPQERRREFQRRFLKFRSGRLSSDQSQKADGKTRYTSILELHENEMGQVEHEDPSSQLEKAVDKESKQATTIQDTQGNSTTVSAEERANQTPYNFVAPHDTLKTQPDDSPRDPDDPPDSRIDVTEEAIKAKGLQEIVDSDHVRKVLKPGAREEFKKVGTEYAKQTEKEASPCAYQPDYPGCESEVRANRDFLSEEAAWLKAKVTVRTEDKIYLLEKERLNEGAAQFPDFKDEKLKGNERALAANRDPKDPTNRIRIFNYTKRDVLPNFKVQEGPPEEKTIKPNDLKGRLAHELELQAVEEIIKAREANPEDEINKPDFKKKSSEEWLVIYRKDPKLKEELRAAIQLVASDPSRWDIRSLKDELKASKVCKDPRVICVYDPSTDALVPFSQYYKTDDYGNVVKNLDEIMARDNYLEMTNPMLATGAHIQAGTLDHLDAKYKDNGKSDSEERAEAIQKLRDHVADVQRTLIIQRDQAVAKGEQAPPIPSQEEILASLLNGGAIAQTDGTGGSLTGEQNNPYDPASYDPEKTNAWINIDERNPAAKKVANRPDTFSGLESNADGILSPEVYKEFGIKPPSKNR